LEVESLGRKRVVESLIRDYFGFSMQGAGSELFFESFGVDANTLPVFSKAEFR